MASVFRRLVTTYERRRSNSQTARVIRRIRERHKRRCEQRARWAELLMNTLWRSVQTSHRKRAIQSCYSGDTPEDGRRRRHRAEGYGAMDGRQAEEEST